MTKIKVTESFKYGGELYEAGETYDVPESVADRAQETGHGSQVLEETETEITPVIEPEEEEQTGSVWDQLEEDLEVASDLPPKWNASRDDTSEPTPNPLKGEVVNTGKARYGKFVVIKEHGQPTEHTVFAQTALKAFCHSVKPGDRVAVRFEGREKNPSGQTYLAYSAAARTPDGERRYMQEPEEEGE